MNSVQGKATKLRTYHTREGYTALSFGILPFLLLFLYTYAYDLIWDFLFDLAPLSIYRVAAFFSDMQYNLLIGLLVIPAVPFMIFISGARLNRLGKSGTKLGWVGATIFLVAILLLIVDNIFYYTNAGDELVETFLDNILYPIMIITYLLSLAFALGIFIYTLFAKPKKLGEAAKEAGSDNSNLVAEAQKQGKKLTASAYLIYILPSLLFVASVLYAVINPLYALLVDIDRSIITEMLAPLFLITLSILNYYTVRLILTRKANKAETSQHSVVVKAMTSKLSQFKGRADGKELAKVSLYSLASFASFFAAMNVLYPGFVFLITNRPFLDIIMSYAEDGYEGQISQYFMVALVTVQLLWATLALISTSIRRINDARLAK